MDFGNRGGHGRERMGPRAWRYGTVGAGDGEFFYHVAVKDCLMFKLKA
jgi:hypothetical protein